MMKDESNIDELLNSFVDGELNERQQTEIRRLIAHDADAAGRLREIQKCKMLVGSLPPAETPDYILEQVKTLMERRTLLNERPLQNGHARGARHLLAHKVLAVAAMIGLVAVLGVVVYTIVAPEGVTDKPVVSESWQQPAGVAEEVQLQTSMTAAVEKPAAEAGAARMGFYGRLELKTSAPIAVDAFVNRAIEDNVLLERANQTREGDKNVYTLSCSREAMSLLLADLEGVWARLDSATLFIETGQVGAAVIVDAVTVEQIDRIIGQDSFAGRIRVAEDFAVLNNMAKLTPAKEVLAVIDNTRSDLITIPKPILTSGKERSKRAATKTKNEQKINLTIVVTGGE